MTRYIKSDYNQHVAAGASTTLHSSAGLVRALIATCSSTTAQTITLYDNTAASGNVLLIIFVSAYAPVIIILPQNYPLKFSTGLTVVTAASTDLFALTEV